MLGAHKISLTNEQEMVLQEKELIAMMQNGSKSDPERYCDKMEEILVRKIATAKELQCLLQSYRTSLKAEEAASERLKGHHIPSY